MLTLIPTVVTRAYVTLHGFVEVGPAVLVRFGSLSLGSDLISDFFRIGFVGAIAVLADAARLPSRDPCELLLEVSLLLSPCGTVLSFEPC